jgi:hypothetical protein
LDRDAVEAHERICQVRLRAADPLHADFVKHLLAVASPAKAKAQLQQAVDEGVPPPSRWLRCVAPKV